MTSRSRGSSLTFPVLSVAIIRCCVITALLFTSSGLKSFILSLAPGRVSSAYTIGELVEKLCYGLWTPWVSPTCALNSYVATYGGAGRISVSLAG